MPHVITQSCCSDGSCVYACPVNCIHPSPDEPGFATAEMLYIDPVACVDCGACVSACPVGAIAPDARLTSEQLPFIALNAAFYPDRPAGEKLPPTSKLAPVIPAPEVRGNHAGPLTVAIVGSGPAAMYAADELLTQHGVRVNVFEKLPTPYGLVRAGVAPDHQTTKRVTQLFDRIARRREFRFFLNIEIGKHLSHDDLLAHHHAVIYASGAPNDRRLDIEGMDLPGTGTATELVAWINGHPDFTDLPVDLSHERVIVVGNGNVAFDVARVLTADPDELAHTDISDHALRALRASQVQEVVIVARRGPEHSAFTLPELIGLTTTAEVVLSGADREAVLRDLPEAERTATVRHFSRLFVIGANLEIPFGTIVLRKGYGLGAQAMAGGSFKAPLFTVGWPTSEFGGMGLEGAVRLGMRRELDAIEDPEERERVFRATVAAAYAHGEGLNMAAYGEIDDVIDPADSRGWIAMLFDDASGRWRRRESKKRPNIDAW